MTRAAGVVNGAGKIAATLARIEKNDAAVMNSAIDIRQTCRDRRGPPRSTPARMVLKSPKAPDRQRMPNRKNGTHGRPNNLPVGLVIAAIARPVVVTPST